MAFIEELKDKAMELTQAGVAKSKQLAEIAKLTLANGGEEDTIRKAYVELGRLYYAERGMAPETAYTALCEKITAAKINIEENKARIAQIREEGQIKDADLSAVETEIPAEEPAAGFETEEEAVPEQTPVQDCEEEPWEETEAEDE
ncbi:serine proteinase [Pseudoflavonifractor sp. 524-17]|uniref:serine proteinase n=1 Tax=Pseudoflavonifractor sp. 524-17 TaxID=2304577 RepID=UPI00137A9DEC|nr:serine proteinase [Pseudoflavonifractor sp. 524-17]NCE63504.1 serine proteinase [Pseudoflavonifractor sp. 524-17]